MHKLFFIGLFAIFAFDVVADSVDAACSDPAETQTCHACVCSHHAMDPQPNKPQRFTPPAPKKLIGYQSLFSERLFDKSVFHPPKLSV